MKPITPFLLKSRRIIPCLAFEQLVCPSFIALSERQLDAKCLTDFCFVLSGANKRHRVRLLKINDFTRHIDSAEFPSLVNGVAPGFVSRLSSLK